MYYTNEVTFRVRKGNFKVPDLDKNKLHKLFSKHPAYDDIIKEFIPLIGFENEKPTDELHILDTIEKAKVKSRNFKQALELLKEYSGITFGGGVGLNSETAIRTLLHNTKRFYGDRHIDHELSGGNTGEHPVFAAIKYLYIMKDAGLLEGSDKEVNEKLDIAERGIKQVVYHDNGELIEYGTVATEVKGHGKDLAEVEKDTALELKRLGLQVNQKLKEQNEYSEEKFFDTYYSILIPIQQDLMKIQQEYREAVKGEGREEIKRAQNLLIDEFIKSIEKIKNTDFASVKLSSENKKIFEDYKKEYFEIEGISGKTALGIASKIAERLEGNSHYIVFKEEFMDDLSRGIIATYKMSDMKLMGNINYVESYSGLLNKFIDNGVGDYSSAQKEFLSSLSSTIESNVNNNAVNILRVGAALLNRKKKSEGYKEDKDRDILKSYMDINKKQAKQRRIDGNHARQLDIVRQIEPVYLYMKADEIGYRRGTHFTKKGKEKGDILIKMDEVPEELVPTKEDIRRYEKQLRERFPELYTKHGFPKNPWKEVDGLSR